MSRSRRKRHARSKGHARSARPARFTGLARLARSARRLRAPGLPILLAVLIVAVLVVHRPPAARATQFRAVMADTSVADTDPTPSRDGKWLAFTSDRSGSKQIWVMPIEGGEPKRLTFEADTVRAMTPTWSPDSRKLLFISTRTRDYNIYEVPREGGEVKAMSDAHASNRFATYSPDGSKIAFASNRLEPGQLWGFDLFLMDPQGETYKVNPAKRLTHNNGSPGHPTWSPDGKWVGYVAKNVDTTQTVKIGPGMTAKKTALFSAYRLWKVDVATGKETQLTGPDKDGTQSEEIWPDWSPDGKYIAMARRVGTKNDVWIYEVATGRLFPLTTFGDCSKPTWGPDSKTLWFTRWKGRNEDIWEATDITIPPPAAKAAVKKKPAARRAPGTKR
ncbi:MAG: DPP IV N-terminal domain-containing protein [Hyphomicrobiales bacterium]